jgi:uncharacterized protein YodC (DUF2158 family)
MSDEFKIGDTVQLNSGSPKMTVVQVGTDGGVPTVWCVWFTGTEEKKGFFPVRAVKSV